jgi:hypothetical protein
MLVCWSLGVVPADLLLLRLLTFTTSQLFGLGTDSSLVEQPDWPAGFRFVSLGYFKVWYERRACPEESVCTVSMYSQYVQSVCTVSLYSQFVLHMVSYTDPFVHRQEASPRRKEGRKEGMIPNSLRSFKFNKKIT